jgi:hypothetical protein
MRKFTNKQADKIEQWLDEAWNEGYKAAEFDVKYRAEFEKVFNAEEVINSLSTAEADMKRAEAEFNKREQVALGYGTPDELYTFWGVRDDN